MGSLVAHTAAGPRATASSALGHARRQEQLVAVALVDIDHFKTVNDVFGHLAGDDVLARTADAIVGCVRSTDLVGRFGGDEFCALLFCAGHDDALATAEGIRRHIAQLSFTDPRLGITASVGLATAPVADSGVGGTDVPRKGAFRVVPTPMGGMGRLP